MPPALHPAIARAIARHREFFAGQRQHLVKISVPVAVPGLPEPPAFDGLDWEQDYDRYVVVNVSNAVRRARARLDLGIADDTIPCYHPYFGISIHSSFFGGAVTFGAGTSYSAPVIARSAEWPQLKADWDSPWPRRLARGLAWCRDHGEGVLPAAFRGADGPLDLANAVLGEALFTELLDDPENSRRLLDTCTQAIIEAFDLQRRHNSCLEGGRIVPMGNLWVPDPNVGHISFDAACLMSPALFEQFERPCIERLAAVCGGVVVHTHMLGRHAFAAMCRTRGLDAVLPRLVDRRAIFTTTADSAAEARAILRRIRRVLPR
ncbi:MAG: hypothetical protein BWZ02_00096 [Lentisphaerae bacterium ADurb.BinA184]|nr:MAG: hypothetical protein BWZ02_00096 [Lentisphaerae bacterium ADurb.BinA184]